MFEEPKLPLHDQELAEQEKRFALMQEVMAAFNYAEDKKGRFESLKTLPGVDPVLAVAEGHPEQIPKEGWFINAELAPGYAGVLDIYRFRDGVLKPGTINDSRETYGSARVSFHFDGYTGKHTIAYENPDFPYKDVEPSSREWQYANTGLSFENTDIIDLKNGGRILDEKDSLVEQNDSRYTSFDFEEIDLANSHALSHGLEINRVVDNPEQFREVIMRLCYAMGMPSEHIEEFLQAVELKVPLDI